MTYGQLATFKVNTEKSSIGFIQCFLRFDEEHQVGTDLTRASFSAAAQDRPCFGWLAQRCCGFEGKRHRELSCDERSEEAACGRTDSEQRNATGNVMACHKI